jgi:RNA polymerase sigma-70 factor (ECF subfamily)
MTPLVEWLGQLRPLLRVEARMLHLDPRLRRRFDYSDLVHETVLRAQQALGDFRGTSQEEMLRWLRKILLNQLRDQVRREHTQKHDVAREQSLNAAAADSSVRLELFLAAASASPSQKLERQQFVLRLASALDAALEQLPEAQRDAIVLNKLQGLPIKEIARRLERTVKAVRLLLYHGLRRLRAMPELNELLAECS